MQWTVPVAQAALTAVVLATVFGGLLIMLMGGGGYWETHT